MRDSFRTGVSFGLTSGIITTLGLMVGLNSGTHSRLAVLSGILTIAIADAFSDALGIHVSEESENRHSAREIWESTIFTFLAKFVFASSFIVPLLLLPLSTAVLVAVIWGFSLLAGFSYFVARVEKARPGPVIAEHVLIAGAVIATTQGLGILLRQFLSGP
jgi:VIT1/CCC1 family predicted Fe2+/Mn2+ transporter